jgi:hypothetical protein
VVHCPKDDLQNAIEAAQPGSTINVSGTCVGNFVIDRNLTLQGIGDKSGNAVIDGHNRNFAMLVAPGVTATLISLTFQHGDPGLANNSGTVNLYSSQVSHNTSFGGVGLLTDGQSGPATTNVYSSSISNNTSTGFGGGGIYNFAHSGQVTTNLYSSSVSGNSAAFGGGIFNDAAFDGGGQATLSLTSSSVTNNRATSGIFYDGDGAGIENNDGESGSAILSLTSSSVASNNADHYGGGIATTGDGGVGSLTMQGSSSVFSNHARVDGGGIYNGDATVALPGLASVFGNTPNNCAGPISVPGCSG